MNCPHDQIEIDDDNLPYCGKCGEDLSESYADTEEAREVDERIQDESN